MKQKKTGGRVLILRFLALVMVLGLAMSCQTKNDTSPVGNGIASEQRTTESPEVRASALGRKISFKAYYNYETRYGTRITFSHWGDTNHGVCTFQEGVMLQGTQCRFLYSYIIENEQINAKFTESDCKGRTTTDRVFYYDEARDVISTIINGETFEFARDGSSYLKRERRSMESISESVREKQSSSNESESGYTTDRDGRIYENASCSLCGGTGIEKSTNSMGGNRICPQCEGTGHQSY